jgi:hypothetical protein
MSSANSRSGVFVTYNNNITETEKVVSTPKLTESYSNDWLAIAKNASYRTVGEMYTILSGVTQCGLIDVKCHTTNTTFQSALWNIARILYNYYLGLGLGFAIGSIWEFVGILAKWLGKLATIIWNVVQLFSVFQVLFSSGADAIKSFLNSDLAGKAFIYGSILGAVVGGLVVKGNAESISEVLTVTAARAKTTVPSITTIVSSVKNIPGTNIGMWVRNGRVSANIKSTLGNDNWFKVQDYIETDFRIIQKPSQVNNPLLGKEYTVKAISDSAKQDFHGFPREVDLFGGYGRQYYRTHLISIPLLITLLGV